MTNVQAKADQANAIVKNYMIGASAVGLLPLPLIDLAALTGIQLKMLHSLAKLYEVEFSKNRGKSLIAALLGGGVPLSLTSSVGSLTKIIPIYGSLVGMISLTVFAGASTYAIGKVFAQHFDSGGTFLNFDPQQVRDYYAKEFETGKVETSKSFAGIKP